MSRKEETLRLIDCKSRRSVEGALEILRGDVGVDVRRLLRVTTLPDPIAARLREWLDRVVGQTPGIALDLDQLDQATRDLSVLYLSSHGFRAATPNAFAPLDAVDLEMTDLHGWGYAAYRAGAATMLLAVSLHGYDGARRVEAARAREQATLRRISKAVRSARR